MIKIDELIKEARLSGNTEDLEVLKLIKTEFQRAQVAESRENPREPLSDKEELQVLQKMKEARRKAIEIYKKSGRSDIAEKEQKEMEYISGFLPKAPDKSEIISGIQEIISTIPEVSMKSMGIIMNQAKVKFPDVSPGDLSSIVKEILIQK